MKRRYLRYKIIPFQELEYCDIVDNSNNAELVVYNSELSDHLNNALESLKGNQRHFIELFFSINTEMTPKQISEEYGITRARVYQKRKQVLSRIRKLLVRKGIKLDD